MIVESGEGDQNSIVWKPITRNTILCCPRCSLKFLQSTQLKLYMYSCTNEYNQTIYLPIDSGAYIDSEIR